MLPIIGAPIREKRLLITDFIDNNVAFLSDGNI